MKLSGFRKNLPSNDFRPHLNVDRCFEIYPSSRGDCLAKFKFTRTGGLKINYLFFITVFTSSLLVHGYAHDRLYRSLAAPIVRYCEARAENAGVSRPNEQILVNNCLDTYHIRVSRSIVNEYPEYARSSGRDPESDEAHRELVKSLHMYENNTFTDPVTGAKSAGAAAQRRLEIELGRKLDQRNSMRNQPALMLDEDQELL